MGNKIPNAPCNSKAQLAFEVAEKFSDIAEDWLGRGVLTAAANVAATELLLPVNTGEVPLTRFCKAVAKVPDTEALDDGPLPMRSRPSVPEGKGPFAVVLASDGASESRAVGVYLSTDRTLPGLRLQEEDRVQIGHIIRRSAGSATEFTISVFVELGSVTFKRVYSPFKDGKLVEEAVREVLEQSQINAPLFVSNYGNCLVEKVFCGGVLQLDFAKVSPSSALSSSEILVQLNGQHFMVKATRRGGPNPFTWADGRSPSIEQLEKQVERWCRSFKDLKNLQTASAIGGVVRLKLAPFSKLAGLSLPLALQSALDRLDFPRLSEWEIAKDGLRQAAKNHRMEELREAVTKAAAVGIEDQEELLPLEQTLQSLDAATEQLKKASQQRDMADLAEALRLAEASDLPAWDEMTYNEAVQLLARRREQEQVAKLQAVGGMAEAGVESMVDAVISSEAEGFSHLQAFRALVGKLCGTIEMLTAQVQSDNLSLQRAEAMEMAFRRLPSVGELAKAAAVGAAFSAAVQAQRARQEHWNDVQSKKAAQESALKALLSEVQRAQRQGDMHNQAELFDQVKASLLEVQTLLDMQNGSTDATPSARGTDANLLSLRQQAAAVLQQRKFMEELAAKLAARMQQAIDTSDRADLERALQDLRAQEASGQLEPGTLSTSLATQATDSLLALWRPDLEASLEAARVEHSKTLADSEEALSRARAVLRRLELCRSTCGEELDRFLNVCVELETELKAAREKGVAEAEVTEKIADIADEWLGKGVLTSSSALAQDLLLPVNVSEVPETRFCKAVVKTPPADLAAEGPSARSKSGALGGGQGSNFAVNLTADGDPESRPVDVYLATDRASPGVRLKEDDRAHIGSLVRRSSASASEFTISVYVELGSVTFKRSASPFKDGKLVEESVRRTLEQPDLDLALFASNYGNCLVEKVFCGGVLRLHFVKVSPDTQLSGSEMALKLGQDQFMVSSGRRGGANTFIGPDAKAPTMEQLEKQIEKWCRSFKDLKTLHAAGGIGGAVRLRLAPFSKLEGLTVPAALERMDYGRLAAWEKAKDDLRRAAKSHKFADLEAAVQQALEVDLEDPNLAQLQATLQKLTAASEQLKKASRQGDLQELAEAVKASEAAGLPEWDGRVHQEAVDLLAAGQEKEHASRLQAASQAAEVSPEKLIEIVQKAYSAGYSHLDEFTTAVEKLSGLIGSLTQQVKSNLLPLERAETLDTLFRTLPEAAPLASVNIAATGFSTAVKDLEKREALRKEAEDKKAALEGSLRQLVSRAQEAQRKGVTSREVELFEQLEASLGDVESLLDAPSDADSQSTAGGVDSTLRTLRQQAAASLQQKKTMEDAAAKLEKKLHQAMEDSTPDSLEKSLQDIDVKQGSGHLESGIINAKLVDTARKQLMALLRPELESHLEAAQAHGEGAGHNSEAFSNAQRVLQRMETCRSVCADELDSHATRTVELKKEHKAMQDKHVAQSEAKEKLKHSLTSGDPENLAEAVRQAKESGVSKGQLMDAEARLRELQALESQLEKALDSGDRVFLSTALQEALNDKLRSPVVDEAQKQLQSSKTSGLVAAIKQRDYTGLSSAIAEAESKSPQEVEDVKDVLEQAKAEFEKLDVVNSRVAAALACFNYADLQTSVGEAHKLKLVTDDVRKAESVLSGMEHALKKLREAAERQPRDLASLQESLHNARQQGLQEHPVYREAETMFAGTCMPPGMTWAIEEQKHMWVVLCLRRVLSRASKSEAAAPEPKQVAHPLAVVIAEMCHWAQLSTDAETFWLQYIQQTLARILNSKGMTKGSAASSSSAGELAQAAVAALEDVSADVGEAKGEVLIDAMQFNRVGMATQQAGMSSTALMLWWLVCVVEWDTEQRLFLAFMTEQARRVADLLTEAESTARSLRTHMVALQANQQAGTEEGTRSRVQAVQGVLEEIDSVKREAEKLQASIQQSKSVPEKPEGGLQDVTRILELLAKAKPESLEGARAVVQGKQREAAGRARDLHAAHYYALEAKLLQLHYKGKQAMDGEVLEAPTSSQRPEGADRAIPDSLPLATIAPCPEAAPSLQDHTFLQLLGVPEGGQSATQSIDRCFQRVEVYENFSQKTGKVEDEFENLCRSAVLEARQRCGGRRLIAALKPLLVDLVKRRQRLSSMVNTLRSCGLDQVEKNLLRKHLQPRDLLIALTFSSMPAGPSQARMMSLVAKTDCPLPLLFGWVLPPQVEKGAAPAVFQPTSQAAATVGSSAAGVQLCSQIHWGALRELLCTPTNPLVLSVGSRSTLGKSYLLQYLYALQECHFRASTSPPLRIHSMPAIDIIGDFAREEPLRGVTLADVHGFDHREELCEGLVATLSTCSAAMLLHVSLAEDFSRANGAAKPQMTADFAALLGTLACGSVASPDVLLFIRDVDIYDEAHGEQEWLTDCVDCIRNALSRGLSKGSSLQVLVWLVPPMKNMAPNEISNEMNSLRKKEASMIFGPSHAPTLEEALASAARSGKRFPAIDVVQQRYETFATSIRQRGAGSPGRGLESLAEKRPKIKKDIFGELAQRVFADLESISSQEGLLTTLFPITHCHQRLTAVCQEKVRCLNRGREYLEPQERRRLEEAAEELDREIAVIKDARQRAPPHALLNTFSQLVILGSLDCVAAFGMYLNEWKQKRRTPLLESKLALRKELDQLMEQSGDDPKSAPGSPTKSGNEPKRAKLLRTELAELQRRLDEVDVSTDSFWLELMLWHEMERIGTRGGLKEIHPRLTFASLKASYLAWVKNGNPVHFLHSAPLQFGAFEPLRWHPQISGASLFGSDFIGDVLRELDRDLCVDVRQRPLLVISVIGVQSSGKSTLMNYLFGCSFATHVGRCTKGLYISLLETKNELVVILDTEGLLSVEARDDVFDKQVALMTMACSDLVIVNNRGELGRHVGDLFQVCLFALYHLKLARISPAIGFVLQCLSMVNQQQQYEWVATVKKSLEESVQELQHSQKEKPGSFKLQDLVFLDSSSIFVMPSAFNDDLQFGLQVSRPTNLYALKALQLREKVFHWISRAKASQKQRLREDASSDLQGVAASSSSFASLSQWYEHARTVWQTLSMCGTDLLQFRTMRQVLMAQQLQEFCDGLVQKHIDGKFIAECEALVARHTRELQGAKATNDVHAIDNAFRGDLDALRDAVLQEMQHEFDEFVKAHDAKFTDEQVKSDKRFSLMGPMRRKYASVDSQWRSGVHLALEQRSMDHLFDEISARVSNLLLEQGQNINVQNVETVFEEKWKQVMAETFRKQQPQLEKVIHEVLWHFNAALSNLKSQFRRSHIFHGVKSLSRNEIGTESEVCNSFLLAKKGLGDALVPRVVPAVIAGVKSQVDNLWLKLVDSMRLEVDQQGQMSDAAALKILNRLNTEMEATDQLRLLQNHLGSPFVQRIFCEIAKATMQYRYQIEERNFQVRMNEILDKKQQKLWELQARVDSGKREVHCAKVWAKQYVDNLDKHFRNAVGRMAQEIVSHMSTILTNPANACDMAIERSFTKRNWRHVVMYAIDPTQYLFMEFHKEWESFKQGLVDQYCRELKSNFSNCLRIVEDRMQSSWTDGSLASIPNLTMNKLSLMLKDRCEELADETLSTVLMAALPTFQTDSDWPLNDLSQFVQFAGVELQRYRANMRKTEMNVERRMDAELLRQKAECWKCISGCPARCPGCGTKCNLENEDHWPGRPHECRRHLYPAFNGWQKQEGRKPFLLHCRANSQWSIARTRPPLQAGGRERFWDNFQAMLEDEHPDWLDPKTHCPPCSLQPSDDYEETCTTAPEDIQREIEENRRAWANCKDALLEHFTSMADDPDVEWLDRFKREGGALRREEFASIRDELFAVTALESLEAISPVDDTSFENVPAA